MLACANTVLSKLTYFIKDTLKKRLASASRFPRIPSLSSLFNELKKTSDGHHWPFLILNHKSANKQRLSASFLH
jgi:hypothetical protein